MRRWLILVLLLGAGCQGPGLYSGDRAAFAPPGYAANYREPLLLPPAPLRDPAQVVIQQASWHGPNGSAAANLPPVAASAADTRTTRFGFVLDFVHLPLPVVRPIAVAMLPESAAPTPRPPVVFARALPAAPPVQTPGIVPAQALVPQTAAVPETRLPVPAAEPFPVAPLPTHALVSCDTQGRHTQVIAPIHAPPAAPSPADETAVPPRPQMALSTAGGPPGFLPASVTAVAPAFTPAFTPVTPASLGSLPAEDVNAFRRMVEALKAGGESSPSDE